MKSRYILPCSCGKELPVDASQAGQEITCACGAKLEVPTMRKLTSLERLEPESVVPASGFKWSTRHAVILVGLLVTAVSLGGMFLVYQKWSYFVEVKQPLSFGYLTSSMFVDVDDLSPFETNTVWDELRQGLSRTAPWEKAYLSWIGWYQRWLIVAGAFAAVGLVTTVSPLLAPKRKRSKRGAKSSKPKSQAAGGGEIVDNSL